MAGKKGFYTIGALILIFLSIIINITLFGRENMKFETTEDKIWETFHEYYVNQDGNEVERDYIVANEAFIKSLPTHIKTIIAFYSTFIPHYLLSEENFDTLLANSLGEYSTLKKAQEVSLDKVEIDYETPDNDFPANLNIKINGNTIFFERFLYRNHINVIDKYNVKSDGTIKSIK
jgi:hypothetical protein